MVSYSQWSDAASRPRKPDIVAGSALPPLQPPAFDDGQSPKLEYGKDIKSQKSLVPAGTVLLSKLNPEIERVWIVDVRPADRAVCSTEFLVLRARLPFGRSFVYCLARSPLFRRQIEGLVTGTSKSHQRAQVGSILNLAVVFPLRRLPRRSVARQTTIWRERSNVGGKPEPLRPCVTRYCPSSSLANSA